MGDAVRKPWETAVPVGPGEPAAGDSVRASESLLDDPSSAAATLPLRRVDVVPQDPRLASTPPLGPTDHLPDLYCVIINEIWYNPRT